MSNSLRIMPSLSPKWSSWDASSYMHPSLGKYMVQCHASKSHSNYSSFSTTTCQNLKLSKLMQVYDTLKSELIHDPSFEFNHISRQWVEQMIDYNVRGGKMIRCLSVLDTYDVLKGEKLTDDEVFLTCTLGWCIEWLQAYLLVHDDLMDGSPTRRGQPCWFRLPKVGMAAVNDGVILRNHVNRILKKHFHGKAYYVHLIDLFNEVEFQTVSGQMIDMLVVGQKDLSKYSMSLNRQIIQYKTGYYTLYLPVACVLLMLGENLDDHVQVKHILVEMGIYYQVQNDYLDTFGDPKMFGKTGSDIQEFKCSWLIAKALELANEEQKKTLSENYGKKDPTCVEKVKQLYDSLNLQGAYDDYENETYEQLIKSIEAHSNKSIQAMLKSCLEKIYKKHK